MTVQTLKRLFTVAEYHQMTEAGIFSEDDRVELIEGEVITVSPIGSRHAACVKRLNHLFSQRIDRQALISIQDPIRLSDYSEPQPDLALLQPRADFYAQEHPTPPDVLLLVEVAETPIEYDREVKIPLYAQAGTAEVWLIDLVDDLIEIYRQPSSTGYKQMQQLRRGQAISPSHLPDFELSVGEIIG